MSTSKSSALAHELWSAAQLAPGEGIEDGVARIQSVLDAIAMAPAEATLFEHSDGRYAVAPGTGSPAFTNGDPAWVRLGPVDVDVGALSATAKPVMGESSDATPDQLIELTAHLERVRARAIIEAVEKIGTDIDPDCMGSHWCGWASALEEAKHRLKTEAWGMLPNGGWGPTGAANEDDKPSPKFPGLLRRVLATTTESSKLAAVMEGPKHG